MIKFGKFFFIRKHMNKTRKSPKIDYTFIGRLVSCFNMKEHKKLRKCTKFHTFFTCRTISARVYRRFTEVEAVAASP